MKAGLAAAILPQTGGVTSSVRRKRRIRQSVSRWCYNQIPLDQLCVAAAQMGLKGVDLLEVAEFDIPRLASSAQWGMPEAGRFRMR
ncbi:MAG TPA: hypothetical protein VGI45_14130 [Terracidiphilus sp.]